jgi:hypothetical protein
VTCLPPCWTLQAIANNIFSLPDIAADSKFEFTLFTSFSCLPQAVSSHGAMSVLAEVAVVLRRDIGCNPFAVSRRQY